MGASCFLPVEEFCEASTLTGMDTSRDRSSNLSRTARSSSAAGGSTNESATHVARRTVLKAGGAVGLAGVLSRGMSSSGAPRATAATPAPSSAVGAPLGASPTGEQVFQHGVASGDPLAQGVIIWTRVTPPDPQVSAVPVSWEVACTPDFRTVVQSGNAAASSAHDFTVKIDVSGLQANTQYWYRFHALGATSRTGRTRTSGSRDHVTFGVCSCSNIEAGYFLAYRDMAARDDIEFVLHLGDYTYEYASGDYLGLYETQVRRTRPAHITRTLQDYRTRQAWYHQDPDLQDLHAAKPMICMWDDHEFADNAWRGGAGGGTVTLNENYAARKAAATQAYFEWMPVRVPADNSGGHLYRSIHYGDLMDIILPDLRTYRDRELLYYGEDTFALTDPDFARASGSPQRSMMGADQFSWLSAQIQNSRGYWQLIGNEVMFSPLTLPDSLDPGIHNWLVHQLGLPPDGIPLNTDQWDGYQAERGKIINLLRTTGRKNTVFLTGDIHSSWAADVPADPTAYRTTREAVATEFVACSVSAASAFDSLTTSPTLTQSNRALMSVGQEALKAVDPWFKFVDLEHHGYMCVDVDRNRVQAEWMFTPDVLHRNNSFSCAARSQALAGKPGARMI